jgi:hypothetical protein
LGNYKKEQLAGSIVLILFVISLLFSIYYNSLTKERLKFVFNSGNSIVCTKDKESKLISINDNWIISYDEIYKNEYLYKLDNCRLMYSEQFNDIRREK